MENQRDSLPPGDSPGVVMSSRCADPPAPDAAGIVQALARRIIMLLLPLVLLLLPPLISL